jgi:hypothetical protein
MLILPSAAGTEGCQRGFCNATPIDEIAVGEEGFSFDQQLVASFGRASTIGKSPTQKTRLAASNSEFNPIQQLGKFVRS